MRKEQEQASTKAAEDSARKSRFARTRPRSFFSATNQEKPVDESQERTPERALMLAVLEDAVACYAGRLKAPRENPKILRRQAAFCEIEVLAQVGHARRVGANILSAQRTDHD